MNRDIRTGLITGGLILVFALALQGLHRAGIVQGDTRELSTRGINILIGLMMVGLANTSAKQLGKLVDLSDAARHQALRRFSAWTLTAAGLTFALCWLALPYDLALYVSMAAVGGAVLTVAGRCVLASRRLA